MFIGKLLNSSVSAIDEFCSRVQVSLVERRGGLIAIFLHNVFADDAEIKRNLVYPQECVTVAHLQSVIEYFQDAGYRFVSESEVLAGLPSQGRYAMLSFDDGYFNTQRALPLLEKFQVPALFFIPAQLVAERRAFWWDLLYRAGCRAGRKQEEIFLDIAYRVEARSENIERSIAAEIGESEFKALGDSDRLFTPEELHRLAAHPLVSIGNHGCVHEHLPSYPITEAAERIQRGQRLLREMTGRTPTAIAYPYGALSDAVVRVARDAGLHLGVTTVFQKEYISRLTDERRMRMSRFTVFGTKEVSRQCRLMRGDLMLSARYRRLVETFR